MVQVVPVTQSPSAPALYLLGDGDDLAHVTEGYGLNDLIADENADLEAWGDANGVDEEEYQVDAEHEQRSSRSKRGSKAGGSKGRKKAQKSPRMAYAATVGGSGSPAGPGGSSGGKVGLPELADAQQQLAALTQNQFGEDHVRRALEETRDSVLGPIEREQGGGQGAGTGAEGQPYGSGAAGVPENGNAGGGNAQGSGAQQPQGQGQDPGQGQLQQPGVEAGSGAGAGVGAGGSGAPAVLVSPAERQRLLHAWLEEAQMWLAVNQEVQVRTNAVSGSQVHVTRQALVTGYRQGACLVTSGKHQEVQAREGGVRHRLLLSCVAGAVPL